MDKEQENHREDENFDPLADFLFRSRRNLEKKKRADDWFMGRKDRVHEKRKDESASEDIPLMNLLKEVDMKKLSGSIDTLMSTASQFKPLIEQVSPLLKKWIK